MPDWKVRVGNCQHTDRKATYVMKTDSPNCTTSTSKLKAERRERKKAGKPTALNEINGSCAISLKRQVRTGQKTMRQFSILRPSEQQALKTSQYKSHKIKETASCSLIRLFYALLGEDNM